MFLLILLPLNVIRSQTTFTFQYVSINTERLHDLSILISSLHSNMFLLILNRPPERSSRSSDFTFQYVSINTGSWTKGRWCLMDFTFQYVSINTNNRVYIRCTDRTLHSNMFLLILFTGSYNSRWNYLYIPICFY